MFNVEDFGANGHDGDSLDDAQWIHNALAAAVANGGGVVYFPPGIYFYKSGPGLVVTSPHDPATPIMIRGDGPKQAYVIVQVTGIPEFIKLSSTTGLGSTANWGMGVRDIALSVPPTVDAITIDNLESAVVENVNVFQSRNPLNVVESRFCNFRNVYALNYAGTGVKITGNTHAANRFEHLQLNGTPGSGWAFEWVHTQVAPGEQAGQIYLGPAGPTLYNVVTNVSGQGGFRFEHVGPGVVSLFPFLNNCVADGDFGADNFLFKNVNAVYLSNSFAVNHVAGHAGFAFDQAFGVTQVGGVSHSYLAGSSDFAFRNASRDIVLSGVSVSGTTKTYAADATAHRNIVIDNGAPPPTVFPSDYHHLYREFGTPRIVSPLHVLTNTTSGGAPAEFGLLFDENPTQAKYFRVGSDASLQILPASHTSVISSLSDTGVWSAAGFVGPLTGSVTGSVTGALTGSVTGTASGNITKQPLNLSGTPDTAGIHITGNMRSAVSFHENTTDISTLSGQVNAMDTAAPAALTGGIVNLGGVYGGSAATPFAGIQGYKANGTSGNYAGGLRFLTRPHGQTYVERVRIDEKGILSTSVGGAVASASSMVPTGNVFHVTGSTSITSISGTGLRAGATLTLIFDGTATVIDGGSLKLAGNFVATADDTLELVWDGTNWYETRRSAN